jgi:hypothetical protein
MPELIEAPVSEEQRNKNAVLIAQDILVWLGQDYLDVVHCYLYADGHHFTPDMPGDATEHMEVFKKNCSVCALGACFLAHIGRFDKMPADELRRMAISGTMLRRPMQIRLSDAFSTEQLNLIETAFERELYGTDSDELQQRALDFGAKYSRKRLRLQGICENIVQNNGRFVP